MEKIEDISDSSLVASMNETKEHEIGGEKGGDRLIGSLFTTVKCYHALFILMHRLILLAASALVLTLGLVVSVSSDVSQLYGQQNQTSNTTSTQQGQQNQTTGIGTASEIENMTAGNIPVIGNETDIQNQNDTSISEGLQKEQLTTDTNMTGNQTGGGGAEGTTNETAATNQTGGGEGQQGNQTEKGPLEQIGEAITDVFEGGGGANPSN